jgi:hypothetical protein
MIVPHPSLEQPDEQLRYARLLSWGTGAGLAVLLLSFAAYVCGLIEAQVAPGRLPELWALPVGTYQQLTGTPTGWGWLALARRSDMAALLGIAVLAGSSALCLLALAASYLRRKDLVYAALCVAEVAVIVVAATGWLAPGL